MPNIPMFLHNSRSTQQHGGTLFERMHRAANVPIPQAAADPVHVVCSPIAVDQNVVVVEQPAGDLDTDVRFSRAEVDGMPGIVMQQRQADGAWHEIWSLPTHSVDAREGMFGWLNTQSHRWDRFARMLQRRGADELTNWIFELMVQPTAAAARPPRLQPQAWATIDQYRSPRASHAVRNMTNARVDDCVCRHNPRDF